eukprot:scaffold89032_cov18-Tisochrysis_lutea.AAC.1
MYGIKTKAACSLPSLPACAPPAHTSRHSYYPASHAHSLLSVAPVCREMCGRHRCGGRMSGKQGLYVQGEGRKWHEGEMSQRQAQALLHHLNPLQVLIFEQ